jgi:aspartyl-tRNA(Asn)/glutamyl-tRNA(Gln) amidotransferase subunit B
MTKTKIGLEIHGYIDTQEKLFCTCKAEHDKKLGAKPNTNICPICTAQPGCKPLLPNKSAIDKAIQIALILRCKINENIPWQRKHYSWPDLPKGYQNTLSGPHAIPLGVKGKFLGIRIIECHLEEDPAAWNPQTGEIDYNRSGSPLIEIVTEPDFKDSEQVEEWLKQLITTLSYIRAMDKKAGIKSDVNVSISETDHTRIEIKNVNSITNIKNAIDLEVKRQEKELPIKQETRRFNAEKQTTELMRTKEQAQDYRFISDPDLPRIKITKSRVETLKKTIPETPQIKLEKLIKKHKIPEKSAKILTKNIDLIELFEKLLETKINPILATRWTTEELLSVLNYNKKNLEDIDILPKHFLELLELIENKTLTELKAKDILRTWKERSSSPKKAAKESSTISDTSQIEKWAKQIIKENSKAVEDFKSGQQQALNFLIGQVMRISEKRADYQTAKKVLEKELG